MKKDILLIADAGSTKTDWVAVDKDGRRLFETRTDGLNPELLTPDEFLRRLSRSPELSAHAGDITQLYFYGAGCGTADAVATVEGVLRRFFSRARVHVAEDMLGAALAATQGREAIVSIIGTGSNSAYFDGRHLRPHVVSLGYILMDEGSGNWLGKQLLLDYYYRRMPGTLAKEFATEYDLDPATVKQNLYHGENPSEYLARFSRFLSRHHQTDYGRKLLAAGFDLFIRNRLLVYEQIRRVPLYFTGSIAYYYAAHLEKQLSRHGLKAAGIIRKPIEGLVRWHLGNFR